MREIKFRFWVDGANGEFMIYPDNRESSNFNSEGWEFYLDDESFEIINHRGVVEPAHHVPMQYTGLKDKNGVEIYEGDVVKRNIYLPGDDVIQVVGEIRYFEHEARFVFRYNGINYDAYHRLNEWVIGNIFENPELLEEEE